MTKDKYKSGTRLNLADDIFIVSMITFELRFNEVRYVIQRTSTTY